MPLIEAWIKAWLYLGFVIGWSRAVRPQFDISTDMGLVLVPADAEVDSAIFRLRATDQDADFPLVFDITATSTPIVRVENLPCTLYNKVCQANVILVRRLIPGRLHDFVVRVKDSKGDFNSMQATISVTNATTPRDKIFPHIPSLIMVPEDAKPGKELDNILVRSNPWSGKPVYIELWQPKELFKIRQRQTTSQTLGVITLIGELDFETQSMYTLTIYATDPYTERGKDTRNIAGLQVVVIVQDVQDVPPIFTLAPPLTKINNTVQPGDVILRVHAEDGDKGVPRVVTYGLLPENNPFVSFFNISEMTGEITLARPLQELTQITYVGAPVVLKVIAEEIRRSREEPPAQSTVVEVGFLLGEPGNNPPHFENDNYMAWLDENAEPGKVVMFTDPYLTKVKDEDVGKAGVFALKLANNNGTFEVSPTVGERSVNFIITVRDNTLIDYELHRSLHFNIIAQEVGPSTNLSTSVPVTIFLRDINDNSPEFDNELYEVEISENATAGTKVIQVHATDKDSGLYGMILYTRITGPGSEAFTMDPNTGVISVAMGSKLDRELTSQLRLSVEARDEVGRGLRGVVPLIVNLLDVNDNAPIFDKSSYEFTLNGELTNFTMPAIIKATDADAEPPNNVVRYEIIHGNYDNKFYLNEVTGELVLREPVNRTRYIRQNTHSKQRSLDSNGNVTQNSSKTVKFLESTTQSYKINETSDTKNGEARIKRAEDAALFTLTARAYDLGVPHLSSQTRIRVLRGVVMGARIVLFVMPGEHPDPAKTADTLATITGGRVIIQEIRPYVPQPSDSEGGKKSVIVARVEQKGSGTLVDIEKIRDILAANGVGVISGMDPTDGIPSGEVIGDTKIVTNNSVTIHNEEVTVYKAENKLLMWLLILLGLLILLAIICLIICCICPGCPFYMEPRKRRIHSSETLIYRADGRPKRHLHRKRTILEGVITDSTKKQAWSADPMKRNWQFNRRNTKQYGIASLPGDVVRETGVDIEPKRNALSLRLPDSPVPVHRIRDFVRRSDDDRIYIEDVEGHARNYDSLDVDSIRRHEIARGSDISRQRQLANQNAKIREQHFFKEGNAEVMRLVTRGQDEERTRLEERDQLQERDQFQERGQFQERNQFQERDHLQGRGQVHRPVALVIEQPSHLYRDGKDILLQRFIEDQEMRQDLHGSRHDVEGVSMESHQHPKEMSAIRQEILLIPQRLDLDQRYHYDDLRPDFQRLVIDRGDYEETRRNEEHVNARRESQGPREGGGEALASEPASKSVENSTNDARDRLQPNLQTYTINEVELVRQNALLTRLLLERETSKGVGETLMDGSFLETQSLPGQVATATQTDRTTATQTDRQVRSRSDNDESEDDDRLRKKTKVKKKSEVQPKSMKTIWIKSAIPEEVHRRDDQSSIFRKRVSDSREMKRASVSPEVLQEISDSLDERGNGSSPREDEEDDLLKIHQRTIGKKGKRYESKTDSTSPETEKERFVKSRAKKAKEKPGFVVSAARKKGEPSFRILEKEMSSLQKKIRTFSNRKSKKVDEVEDESDPLVCDSKEVEKKVTKVRDLKKKLKPDLELKLDRELKHDSVELFPEEKQEKARWKKKPLKEQHAVQTLNLEIVDQEDVPEKGKKYLLKKSNEQSNVKKSSGSFKLKRQSRMQVSKGAVKSIISRTKEVAKRKVRELKKEDDSSGEKQKFGQRILGKQVTEGSKKPSKTGADASKRAYTIVSTRVESPPSNVSESEKEKQQKIAESGKLVQLNKDSNKISKKPIEQQSIPGERVTDFEGQTLGAGGSREVSVDHQSVKTDSEKKQILKQDSTVDGKKILDQESIAKDEKEDMILDQRSPAKARRSKTPLDKEWLSMEQQPVATDKDKPSFDEQPLSPDGDKKPSLNEESYEADKCSKLPSERKTSPTERSKTPLSKEDVETEKSRPKIKELMLETDDMRFIDDSQESTDASEETHSTIKENDKADIEVQSQSSDLESEKKAEYMGRLSREEKETIKEPEENEDNISKQIDRKVKSPESSSESGESKSDEDMLRQQKEFPYKHLRESDVSTDSFADHEGIDRRERVESKAPEDPIHDERIGLEEDKKKKDQEDQKENGTEKEQKGDVREDVKGEVQEKKVNSIPEEGKCEAQTNIKETVSDQKEIDAQVKPETLKLPESGKADVKLDEKQESTPSTPSSALKDVSSQIENTQPTASDDGSSKITSPKKKDEMPETVNTSESSHQVLSADRLISSAPVEPTDKITDKIPKTVDETTVSKPTTPKVKSISPEIDLTTQPFHRSSTPIRISSRDEDHDRKLAKMLAEEQERLQRLELLYKHYNESEDDSDSSTDSDMSSKTMLTTQPYQTPRHSPIRELKDDELRMTDVKDEPKTVAKSPRILQKEAEVVPPTGLHLRIPRQSAIDVDDEKVDVTKHKDGQKPVVVDVVKKENLKDPSIPQKPGSRSETHLRSSKTLVPKSSPHTEAKKAHLSEDEARERSKLIKNKIPLVADVEKGPQDMKIQQGHSKKEDSKSIGKSRKQINSKVISKEISKGPEPLDAKDAEKKKMVSKRDGRKLPLDKSASTTDVEKQLRKETHPKKGNRSLSPRKEVKKHFFDEEIKSKLPLPAEKEKEQIDQDKKSQKSPRREVRKPVDDEGKKQKATRDKSPLVSEKVQKAEDQKDDHHRQLHITKPKIDKDLKSDSGTEEVIKAQSRYMGWYKQKREEMEKKRMERKLAEEEEQRPRWMKRSKMTKPREHSNKNTEVYPDGTPKGKHKVKPSVNVESEQLKAIVRQGRKMRKAEGQKGDLTVQIFAPKKPPPVQEDLMQPIPKHPLIQHSEYKYEKMPTPFYLHPPPAPHPSPQGSPENFPDKEARKPDDDLDSGIAVSLQGGTRLRHQQLLEKKSVFDIAYNEAAPSHLRSDSSTPPS